MRQSKKLLTSLVIIGGTIVAGGLILSNQLSTFLIAFGCGLMGASLGKLIVQKRLDRSPEKKRAYQISEKDPRHQEIRIKAYATGGRFLELAVIILAMVVTFAKQPLWLVCVLGGLFVAYQVIVYFSMVRLNKTM